MQQITVDDFFGGVFLDCYVCLLDPEKGGQFNGFKPMDEIDKYESYEKIFEDKCYKQNKSGSGVHFTPNGVIKVEEIDIELTKWVIDKADEEKREKRKSEILGAFFMLDKYPSMLNETRNGFQALWFATSGSVENFDKIQKGLSREFTRWGVECDESSMNLWSMLRVPGFYYHKNNETGLVRPIQQFSTYQLYSEQEMVDWLKPSFVETKSLTDMLKSVPVTFNRWVNTQRVSDVETILKYPIKRLIELISGTDMVNGDIIELKGVEPKYNLLVNGKGSPNWIDTEKNMLFSNNVKGMANIIHYVSYYGRTKSDSINMLIKKIKSY